MKTFVLAAGTLVSLGSGAMAATELFLDINTLNGTFTNNAGGHGGFGLNATGTISLAKNIHSSLQGIRIDGVEQGPLTSTLTAFVGQITLVNGGVTGGFMHETNGDGTQWMTALVAGSGQVNKQAGQGFSIDALTFQNLFVVTQPNSKFAGVDITPWYTTQPNAGTVLTFAFNPNANGFDSSTDVDAVITVPMPTAAGLGFAGLAGLATGRRRR